MLPEIDIFLLVFLFLTKHLICDFFLQGPYQYKNKGTFGHPGGLLHAAIHSVGSFIALFICAMIFRIEAPVAMISIIVEFVLHYSIDWAKVNINKKNNWGPLTSENFWYLTGTDQFFHHITNLLMIMAVVYFR